MIFVVAIFVGITLAKTQRENKEKKSNEHVNSNAILIPMVQLFEVSPESSVVPNLGRIRKLSCVEHNGLFRLRRTMNSKQVIWFFTEMVIKQKGHKESQTDKCNHNE